MEVVEALAVDFPTDTKITVFAPSDAAFQTVLQASTSEFGVSLEPQAIAQVCFPHACERLSAYHFSGLVSSSAWYWSFSVAGRA